MSKYHHIEFDPTWPERGAAAGSSISAAAATGAPQLDATVSVEYIARVLHERMLEAAATWPDPIIPGTCEEDGHLEEASDLHSRLWPPP